MIQLTCELIQGIFLALGADRELQARLGQNDLTTFYLARLVSWLSMLNEGSFNPSGTDSIRKFVGQMVICSYLTIIIFIICHDDKETWS
jgi:hypothetical protein